MGLETSIDRASAKLGLEPGLSFGEIHTRLVEELARLEDLSKNGRNKMLRVSNAKLLQELEPFREPVALWAEIDDFCRRVADAPKVDARLKLEHGKLLERLAGLPNDDRVLLAEQLKDALDKKSSPFQAPAVAPAPPAEPAPPAPFISPVPFSAPILPVPCVPCAEPPPLIPTPEPVEPVQQVREPSPAPSPSPVELAPAEEARTQLAPEVLAPSPEPPAQLVPPVASPELGDLPAPLNAPEPCPASPEGPVLVAPPLGQLPIEVAQASLPAQEPAPLQPPSLPPLVDLPEAFWAFHLTNAHKGQSYELRCIAGPEFRIGRNRPKVHFATHFLPETTRNADKTRATSSIHCRLVLAQGSVSLHDGLPGKPSTMGTKMDGVATTGPLDISAALTDGKAHDIGAGPFILALRLLGSLPSPGKQGGALTFTPIPAGTEVCWQALWLLGEVGLAFGLDATLPNPVSPTDKRSSLRLTFEEGKLFITANSQVTDLRLDGASLAPGVRTELSGSRTLQWGTRVLGLALRGPQPYP
jgi:hypothetical protein